MHDLLNRVKQHPGSIFRSKNDIAQRFNITRQEAEDLISHILFEGNNSHSDAYISGRKSTKDGELVNIISARPMQPDELAKLAGVDGIRYGMKTWYLKSKHGASLWDYTILLKTLIENFYSDDELKEKVHELLPSYKPVRLPVRHARKVNPARAAVYTSDPHAGATNKGTIFAKPYTSTTMQDRLLQLVDNIEDMDLNVESLDIAILGDQMDGFNAETTRGGHKLDSLSNKEQFDIYVSGMKEFYTGLFSLGLADHISIINVDNSNHAGNGLSYFANSVIHEWLKGNFPHIEFISSSEPIFHRNYGKHTIAYTHGKDEKYMKRPMPLNLDAKTDLFLQSYFNHHGLQNQFCHLVKGDLHQYGVSEGKFGRYVNVGSIVGGNNYSDLNFGKSTPSALVEVMKPDRKWINSIKIDLE